MCTIVHMKDPGNSNDNYYILRDAASALEYGSIKSDKRIQVKMPSFVVDALDKEFPDQDRSSAITQAVLELLLRKKRISDANLEHWQNDEQYDMDRMWNYLEERDASS